MREIIVDFTADIPIEPGTIIGRQGENNATELKIKIPTEMLNSEEIEMVTLAAQIGASYVARSELIAKDETVTVKLDSRMTAVNSLSIQLEGYDSAKSLIVKSAKIDNLILEKSVIGETPELNNNSDIISSIAANTAARHTHSNGDTLDKLGNSNGTLTYDGKPVGGGERATAELEFTEEWGDFLISTDIISKKVSITVDSNVLSTETEIKSISVLFEDQENFTDLRDLTLKINENCEPCVIAYHHPSIDEGDLGFAGFRVAALYFPSGGAAYSKFNGYQYLAVKIVYYTE